MRGVQRHHVLAILNARRILREFGVCGAEAMFYPQLTWRDIANYLGSILADGWKNERLEDGGMRREERREDRCRRGRSRGGM